MKVMKNSTKCLIAFFVMLFAISLTGITAEAKTKTYKITLYVGEKASEYPSVGTIKSVKSSNKKVVAASKKGSTINLNAKKAGSAKVTVKGKKGTYVYKVTVKKASFSVSGATVNSKGYYLMTLKSQSSSFFESVRVIATFRDSNGNPLKEETFSFYSIAPKSTAYDITYISSYSGIDPSKTTFTVDEFYRTPYYNYKNYEKNVNYSITEVSSDAYSKDYRFTASTSYKGKGGIYAGYDVFFYDAAGNIVDVYSGYMFLYNKSRVDTRNMSVDSSAVRAEIVSKRVYLATRK